MNPIWLLKYWRIGVAALALIGGFLGGWNVRDWKADADTLKAERAASIERDRLTAKMGMLAFEYEQIRNAMGGKRDEAKSTIREIFNHVEVPSNCDLPDDARRLLQQAVDRANSTTASQSGEPVR